MNQLVSVLHATASLGVWRVAAARGSEKQSKSRVSGIEPLRIWIVRVKWQIVGNRICGGDAETIQKGKACLVMSPGGQQWTGKKSFGSVSLPRGRLVSLYKIKWDWQ